MTVENVSEGALSSSAAINRIFVSGEEVDAWEVVVGNDSPGQEAQPIEIEIGALFLRFEFEEMGVEIIDDSLVRTVKQSLEDHQEDAMHSYLGMLRGDYRPEDTARRSGLRILPWFRPPEPKWLWVEWISVEGLEEPGKILIKGKSLAL